MYTYIYIYVCVYVYMYIYNTISYYNIIVVFQRWCRLRGPTTCFTPTLKQASATATVVQGRLWLPCGCGTVLQQLFLVLLLVLLALGL